MLRRRGPVRPVLGTAVLLALVACGPAPADPTLPESPALPTTPTTTPRTDSGPDTEAETEAEAEVEVEVEALGIDLTAHSTSDPDSPWVVVNPDRAFDPLDHEPDDLVTVQGHQVRKMVAGDLRTLLDAAREDGVHVTLTSAFRSYEAQHRAHAGAIARNGRVVGEQISARPGHSEHQSGLAVDFGSSTRPGCNLARLCFDETVEAVWLAEHASRHGFILRYAPGQESVTGYLSEGWHFRWVGRELATWMQDEGLTTLEDVFGLPPAGSADD
ncbi:M15 family metallopeptidase [Oerskovia flava]|uniref:M15 family metallopeptidase n=1 Tax=Oerskovia flava TaxID=2986422 RepID=UPI00223EDD35|nr:M15 family metallopeptidase [Oerskovia sp. JB1-3-2]